MPAISICTPVYNGMPYIQECVESVLGQDYEDWELIISDNCSTDGTREYLSALKDKRIKVLLQTDNKGIFGNLNAVIKAAEGEIIQILCADDYFSTPTALQKLVSIWQGLPDEVGFMRINTKPETTIGVAVPHIIQAQDSALFFYLFVNIPGNLSNVSMRPQIFKEVGYFSQDFPYAGDFEFWVRAAQKFDFKLSTKQLIYIRRHPGVASNYLNQNGELIMQKLPIINDLFQKLHKKYPNHKAKLRFYGILNYDSLQRDIAIKNILRNKWSYFKELNKAALVYDFSINPHERWVIFFLSLGGRIGRSKFSKLILKKLLN